MPDIDQSALIARLPPDVRIDDRYTPTEWLDVLRDQFRPETWTQAILAEALRLGVAQVHIHQISPSAIDNTVLDKKD